MLLPSIPSLNLLSVVSAQLFLTEINIYISLVNLIVSLDSLLSSSYLVSPNILRHHLDWGNPWKAPEGVTRSLQEDRLSHRGSSQCGHTEAPFKHLAIVDVILHQVILHEAITEFVQLVQEKTFFLHIKEFVVMIHGGVENSSLLVAFFLILGAVSRNGGACFWNCSYLDRKRSRRCLWHGALWYPIIARIDSDRKTSHRNSSAPAVPKCFSGTRRNNITVIWIPRIGKFVDITTPKTGKPFWVDWLCRCGTLGSILCIKKRKVERGAVVGCTGGSERQINSIFTYLFMCVAARLLTVGCFLLITITTNNQNSSSHNLISPFQTQVLFIL
ncbi:putative signal peptide protein [Puccinia sorghi]|uniref:Putative signal peptide protein n=1 Tax=Puccinia sorghi TaxID=27349 RepID=A0A0L6VAN0_9BASI|nr:putative signal peptide protein [Puccinia sorghi]